MYKIGDRVIAKRNCHNINVGDLGIIVDAPIDGIHLHTTYEVNFSGRPYYLDEHELALDDSRQQVVKEYVEIGLPTPGNQTIDEYLSEVTDLFNELKDKYITDDVVKHELNTRYYGYDGAYEVILTTYRSETTEEYVERIEYERIRNEREERKRLEKLEQKKAKREAAEAVERAEYERLKAKFGVE